MWYILSSDIRTASSPGIIVKQSVEITCKSVVKVARKINNEMLKIRSKSLRATQLLESLSMTFTADGKRQTAKMASDFFFFSFNP